MISEVFPYTVYIPQNTELDTNSYEHGDEPFVVANGVYGVATGIFNNALRVQVPDVPFLLYWHQPERTPISSSAR